MLVSCIMPTRGRAEFAAAAVECFLSQTWAEKELVIVDDADAPSFPAQPDFVGVSYHRLNGRLPIGAKRNICCSRAAGAIIAHFDDDDWSASGRLSDQIERLVNSGATVTGYHSMRFTDGARWWQYSGQEDYALGTSLVYRREYWESSPFPTECQVGEDVHFIFPARAARQIVSVDADEMMFARNHAGNTDSRDMKNLKQWREVA